MFLSTCNGEEVRHGDAMIIHLSSALFAIFAGELYIRRCPNAYAPLDDRDLEVLHNQLRPIAPLLPDMLFAYRGGDVPGAVHYQPLIPVLSNVGSHEHWDIAIPNPTHMSEVRRPDRWQV